MNYSISDVSYIMLLLILDSFLELLLKTLSDIIMGTLNIWGNFNVNKRIDIPVVYGRTSNLRGMTLCDSLSQI